MECPHPSIMRPSMRCRHGVGAINRSTQQQYTPRENTAGWIMESKTTNDQVDLYHEETESTLSTCSEDRYFEDDSPALDVLSDFEEADVPIPMHNDTPLASDVETGVTFTEERPTSANEVRSRGTPHLTNDPLSMLSCFLVECFICRGEFRVTSGRVAFNQNCTHYQCLDCLLADYTFRIGPIDESMFGLSLPAKNCPFCRQMSSNYITFYTNAGGCSLANITTCYQLVQLVNFFHTCNQQQICSRPE